MDQIMTSRKLGAPARNELEDKLRRMLGAEEDIGTALLVDLLTVPASSSVADAAKAAARTRDYKVKQILAGDPESGDVSSACAFFLLNHARVLLIAPLVGAILMVWVDLVSRTLVAPRELPLGVITALVGVPVFITLMRRRGYVFGGR